MNFKKYSIRGMARFSKSLRRTVRLLAVAVAICSGILRAQNEAGGSAAKGALQRVLEAVQAGDVQSANLAFAQLRNQDGPRAYAEIARTEAKIPGRAQRVLCWFAAYLAADPKAPDTAAVTAEIDRLDAEARGQITHLLGALQDAVVQSPSGDARNYEMRDMVGRWTQLGDFASAKRVIDLIDSPNTKSDALTNLASAYCQLIHQQVDCGNLKGARASVTEAERAWKQVPNVNTELEAQYYVASSWIGFARGQVRTGDWKGAQESLATALKLNGDLTSPGDTNNVWNNIGGVQVAMAKGQIKAGDRDGGRASISAALQTADLLGNDPFREEASLLQDIADAQMLAGDISGAHDSLVRASSLSD
jgi:tetratricopeptide (TPR) repeat protein